MGLYNDLSDQELTIIGLRAENNDLSVKLEHVNEELKNKGQELAALTSNLKQLGSQLFYLPEVQKMLLRVQDPRHDPAWGFIRAHKGCRCKGCVSGVSKGPVHLDGFPKNEG